MLRRNIGVEGLDAPHHLDHTSRLSDQAQSVAIINNQAQSEAIRGHQKQSGGLGCTRVHSVAIGCNHVHSLAISGHQWSSVVISGHQWQSVVISGNQWSSVANQWPETDLGVEEGSEDCEHGADRSICRDDIESSGHLRPEAIGGNQRPSEAGHQGRHRELRSPRGSSLEGWARQH